jgi:lipopolysaccharide transport system ATP-binding protein
MSLPMIEIKNVSKEYRLGAIGGRTLNAEIQTKLAKLRGKEDPNSKLGAKQYSHNERFLALDGISFSVQPGEAVGIIGHNGAGKSTLLKLISRVTAPSGGEIVLRGRVASMLEVGTGFHPELTGRENVYMNGAILGMTKKEIDRKFDQIVEFAEMAQFIDTPVKRYSSGMYVKLAFSVAAHLDAELMIMDEVLAVGDVSFQKKCLEKMNDVSRQENRTILYVSHNMSTIRQLCDRCIVMDRGRLIYDGGVDEAIGIYMGIHTSTDRVLDLRNAFRTPDFTPHPACMTELECLEEEPGEFPLGTKPRFRLSCTAERELENVLLRVIVKDQEGKPVTMLSTGRGVRLSPEEETQLTFRLDVSRLVPGKYTLTLVLYLGDEAGANERVDGLKDVYCFDIARPDGFNGNIPWAQRRWGYFYNEPIVFSESAGPAKGGRAE